MRDSSASRWTLVLYAEKGTSEEMDLTEFACHFVQLEIDHTCLLLCLDQRGIIPLPHPWLLLQSEFEF